MHAFDRDQKKPKPNLYQRMQVSKVGPNRTRTTRGTHSTHWLSSLSLLSHWGSHSSAHLQSPTACRQGRAAAGPATLPPVAADWGRVLCTHHSRAKHPSEKLRAPSFCKGTLNNSDVVAQPPSFVAYSFGSTKNTNSIRFTETVHFLTQIWKMHISSSVYI